MKGTIRISTGSWYEISGEDGKIYQARMKGKLRLDERKNTNPVAVGDHVEFDIDVDGNSTVIKKILPRDNYIIRKPSNLSKQEHVIAANLDEVMIMATLAFPRTSQGFIDRILVTAEAYEIAAAIVFNKTDLYDDAIKAQFKEMYDMYENIGYKCLGISVKTDINLEAVFSMLAHKITLITGHSGVGKSTLLNKLVPELHLKTGEVSNYSLKGKHTTTFAAMFAVGEDTYVIDTPGIKDFGLIDMKPEELSHYFPEMRALLGQCRFSECLHISEPGCAVLEAVKTGSIALSRYKSYLSMLGDEETHR